MGIIAALVALLLPAVRGARQSAVMTQCQANLRSAYFAQMQYAQENRGRFAGIVQTSSERWERRLHEYLTRSEELPPVLDCPALASRPDSGGAASSYGLNSCLMMNNWRMRRDARMDAARIILIGDKSFQQDDFLTTDDGWFLVHPAETGIWFRSVQHRSHSSYRHANGRVANMIMADGHAEAMQRDQLVRDSGHWYWGGIDTIPQIEVDYGEACCP
jgi:prepilin-type processing-associated H-X9-DG protein